MNLSSIIKGLSRRFNRIYTSAYTRYHTSGLRSVGERAKIGYGFMGHGLDKVDIGSNFSCGERLKLRTFAVWGNNRYQPTIKIGDNVSIASDCHISAINSVYIGNNVLLASFVYISDLSHGDPKYEDLSIPPIQRPLHSKGPVKIYDNVWLGEKCTVLPNVTIGEGSIIGANSVVTRDIPPFSIACGIPAKVIKSVPQ